MRSLRLKNIDFMLFLDFSTFSSKMIKNFFCVCFMAVFERIICNKITKTAQKY